MAEDYRHARFYSTPGSVDDALEFAGLGEGNTYRFAFTAAGDVGAHFVLRPGGADATGDIQIPTEGAYDETFTVAAGGNVRFLCTNVDNVDQIDLTDIYIYNAVSESPGSAFEHDFSTGKGPFTHTRAGNATVTQPDGTVDLLGPDEEGIIDGIGIQIEAASSNYIAYSEDLTQWTLVGAAVITPGEAAPDGNNSACYLQGIVSGSGGYIRSQSAVIGVDYEPTAFSMWLKESPVGDEDIANLRNTHPLRGDVDIFLPRPAEWGRYNMNVSVPGLYTTVAAMTLASNGRVIADFKAVNSTPATYMPWGMQSEYLATVPSSYIPSNGAVTMRDPVHVTQTLATLGIADITGDCSGQLTYIDQAESGTADSYYLDLTDGTATNRIRIFRPSGGDSIALNIGAATATVVSAPRTVGTEHTIKFKVDTGADRLVIWYDDTPTEVSGVSAPAGAITQAAVCDDYDAANAAVENAVVKKIRLLDYAADDQDIEGWT